MNWDNWKNLIAHLFVLCGIRHMDEAQHTLYMADMFAELKDRFTDEEIARAARLIAETENLYGNYPPLSVWLKYCPQKRAAAIQDSRAENNFICIIRSLIYCDFVFDGFLEEQEENIARYGGERAKNIVKQFGGVHSIFVNYSKASDFMKEQFLRDVRKCWQESSLNESVGAFALVAQDAPTMIENKN